MLHACIAQTSECDWTHGCVHRVANYFYRVAARGGIRNASGHYDRRNSIVCESDFGHVTGPLKTSLSNSRTRQCSTEKYGISERGKCLNLGAAGAGNLDKPTLLRIHVHVVKKEMYIERNALVSTWLGLCGVTMFLTPASLYVRTS